MVPRLDERRGAPRARISGVRVTYESAAGDHVEADALDLAEGGLFVRTDAPLAVGKRIAMEIQVVGEKGPWSTLGRVVWVREKADGERPAGMGVKLIDVEEAVVEAVHRLVETRERTEPGVGSGAQAHPRGAPITVPPPELAVPPERERTMTGAGEPAPAETPAAGAPDRERSIALDLVAKKESPPAPPAAEPVEAPAPSPPSPPPAAPRAKSAPEPAQAVSSEPPPSGTSRTTGGGRAWIVMLLLAVALVAAYVLWQGGLLMRGATGTPTVAPPTPEHPPTVAPAPPPPAAPGSAPADTASAPSAAPPASTPGSSAPPGPSPSASARPSNGKPGASTSGAPRRPAPSGAPARKPSIDNPY